MHLLIIISLILLLSYVYKILKSKRRWEQYPEMNDRLVVHPVPISVIIAFRDELQHLPDLLSSLAAQDYPAVSLEVILVNDHSADGSEVLAQQFCQGHAQFRLIHNDPAATGKKSAIKKGIQAASHDLVVTTDADCSMHPGWLATLSRVYAEKNADMIVGLVDIQSGKSFFGQFQEVEFLSLVASGAAALAGGRAIYCNGANLAYKRSVFSSYADPLVQKLASGEDTLFLHALKRHRGSRIVLAKARTAVVTTRGTSSWKGFMEQRKRWVSKSLFYRDTDTLFTAASVLLVNVFLLISLALLVAGRNLWLHPLVFTMKTAAELLFIRSFMRFYGKKLPVVRFMAYAWIYPFYAVFFAITGVFSGFRWKGRSYRPSFPIPT